MQNDSRLSGKIKAQITRFAGRLTEGLGRVTRRWISEMLYGIQASKDVKVSEVARSLNEPIRLIKTENRLCRNLASDDLTGRINRWTSWEGAGAVDDDTVLALDLGDVRKSHAKKMEHLATVRDGSTGELVPGYWLIEVLAAHPCGEDVTPLYGELYAHAADDFASENAQILKAVGVVNAATKRRGIWAIDRGGDRRSLLIPFLDGGVRFVVRQHGDRHVLLPSGARWSVSQAARWCRATAHKTVEVTRDGRVVQKHLAMGCLAVRLPDRPTKRVWLVVLRGLADHPIWLLANVPPERGRDHAEWICECYLTRWKCEEAYRFVKQSYHLEDVRVRSYTALRNTYVLAHAVFYFVSAVLGRKAQLAVIFRKVCRQAKRFYEIAGFFHYAVADGIHRLLARSRTGPHPPKPPPHDGQLLFDFVKPLL